MIPLEAGTTKLLFDAIRAFETELPELKGATIEAEVPGQWYPGQGDDPYGGMLTWRMTPPSNSCWIRLIAPGSSYVQPLVLVTLSVPRPGVSSARSLLRGSWDLRKSLDILTCRHDLAVHLAEIALEVARRS